MWIDWLIELGLGIWRVTWQPLLYAAILFTIWTGYKRIKKERRQFGHRIFEITAEWKGTWFWGLLFGLLLSIGLVLAGGMISYEIMLLLSAVVILALLFNQVRLLSPVYTLGFSALLIWGLNQFDVLIINQSITDAIYTVDLLLLSYILIVLLLAEIILIGTTKRNRTFPGLEKSDRGKYVGYHVAKRLMIIPFFVPIQGSGLQLEEWLPWWPVFTMGSTTFSLMLFPFFLGYQQRFHSVFSDHGAKQMAKLLSLLFILLVGLGVGLYWYPEFAYIFFAVALIGRLIIQWETYIRDKRKRSIFGPQQDGITIVGVTPRSPADKMGLIIGEKIARVHDHPVSNEKEFHEIMSTHRTYCKLAVKNLDGEIRFVQRPVYQNENYELGLVFIKETPRFSLRAHTTEEFNLDEVVSATESNQQKQNDFPFLEKDDPPKALESSEPDEALPSGEQNTTSDHQKVVGGLEDEDFGDFPENKESYSVFEELEDDAEPDRQPTQKEVYEDELMELIQELEKNEQDKKE